jgi:hypothetical protein
MTGVEPSRERCPQSAALVQAPIVGATYSLSTLTSANLITVTAVQGSPQHDRSRGLGAIHQIITLDTPEAGSALATFLLGHKDATYQNQESGEVQKVWNGACGKAPGVTVERCLDNMKPQPMNISNGAVASGPNARVKNLYCNA